MDAIDPGAVQPADDWRRREDEALCRRRCAVDPEALTLFEQRRAAEGADAAQAAVLQRQPRVGLALSGGGIRSATFALGVLRGLAGQGLLRRFDYLSTVSGGGYIGAMLMRLIQALGWPQAEQALKRGDSVLMAWLRVNGRYLSPGGSHDFAVVIAHVLRAWVAIQLEVGALILAAGSLLLMPMVLLRHASPRADPPALAGMGSPYWLMAALLVLPVIVSLYASFWQLRPGRPRQPGIALLLLFAPLLGLTLAAAFFAWRGWSSATPALAERLGLATFAYLGLALTLASARVQWLLARAARATGRVPALQLAQMRDRLTLWMSRATLTALVLLALGALERGAWELMQALRADPDWLWSGAGAGGLLLVLRTAASWLAKRQDKDPASPAFGRRLLNVVGLLAGALLLLLWMTALQAWIEAGPALPWLSGPGLDADETAVLRCLAVAATAWLWVGITAGHEDTPNAISLHAFYRDRLVRAFLAVGNPRRFDTAWAEAQQAPGADAAAQPQHTPASTCLGSLLGEQVAPVDQVLAGDDGWLVSGRRPPGLPIHLVNTCLNQTVDDKRWNADRKGLMFSVSALHHELGAEPPIAWPLCELQGETLCPEADTLGHWVAISGAAAAPGAGALTSRGWALLLFLLGARLGVWRRPPPGAVSAGTPPRAGGRFPKWRLLLQEALASFHGPSGLRWYLSDGGHFENTGVYPLLKRQLDLIVLVDAGADPRYAYEDLQNMVRKARIDFDADIAFYDRAQARRALAGLPADSALELLSPRELADRGTERGLLMARIVYGSSQAGPKKVGTLLVLKPALHPGLDLALLGYASENPSFPQETTGDQFFAEAQWEAYQRLGLDLAQALRPDWLAAVPGWAQSVPPLADPPPLDGRLERPAPPSTPIAFPVPPVPAAPEAATPGGPSPWRASARLAAGGVLGAGLLTGLIGWLTASAPPPAARPAGPTAAEQQLLDRLAENHRLLHAAPSCQLDAEAAQGFVQLWDAATAGELPRPEAARLQARIRALCAAPVDPAVAACRQAWRDTLQVGGGHALCRTLDWPFTRPPLRGRAGEPNVAYAQGRAQPQPVAPSPRLPGGPEATVYLQVADEAGRRQAEALRLALAADAAAAPGSERPSLWLPGVQTLVLDARVAWREPTLILPSGGDIEQAETVRAALARGLGRPALRTVTLPGGTAGVFELWLPAR